MAERATQPERGDLWVHFDAHQCQPAEEEYDKMRTSLDGLALLVEHFPQRELRVLIEFNSRSNDYSVKLTLLLPGRTLVGSDHDPVPHAAFDRCLNGIIDNVKAYKDSLGRVPERQKIEERTHQEMMPSSPIDPGAVDTAARAGDYPAYRAALAPYEESLRVRAGRWVERYPAVQGEMGRRMDVMDVVEGVFLAAFDGHEHRPTDVRYGDWLVNLIDPTLRALAAHPDEELQNISMARSASVAGPATPSA